MSKKAAGVIFYRRDKNNEIQILMIERSDYVGIAPAWAIPGGKLEEGETIAQGMIRECEEELGISFDIIAPKDAISLIYKKDFPQLMKELDNWLFYYSIIEANPVESFPGSDEGRVEWKSLSWIMSNMDQLTYPCWMSLALRDLAAWLNHHHGAYYGIDELMMHEPLVLSEKQTDAIKDRWMNMRGKT